MVTGREVLGLLEKLRDASVPVWLDGGWGVDALLGYQHRPHADLDLVVRLDHVTDVVVATNAILEEDYLPTRAVLRCGDLQVDLHPVTFDEEGVGWQAGAAPDGTDCAYPKVGFTVGAIDGVTVPCLSAEVQLQHHLGYQPRVQDHEDMGLLARAFGFALPAPYGDRA